MNEQEFLSTVEAHANLESTDEARAATEATLHVLGSRLTEPEAENLAAQLPEAFGSHLTWESGTEPESFDADAFVGRVRERESGDSRVDESDAETHAKAVGSTLSEAISGGELDDIRAQLPGGYERILNPEEAAS